jgi:hypothetical protein
MLMMSVQWWSGRFESRYGAPHGRSNFPCHLCQDAFRLLCELSFRFEPILFRRSQWPTAFLPMLICAELDLFVGWIHAASIPLSTITSECAGPLRPASGRIKKNIVDKISV